MNLYPRLCSSFLRRSSNNRCSLSSDLFVNLSGRRLETICYSYRPSLPRSAHAASRLVLFLLVESSSRPFEARFPPLWELSSRLEPALSLSSGKCHLSRVFSMFTRQLDTVCTRPREFSLPALCPLRIRYVIFGFSFFSLVENCSWLADIRGEKFYQQKNWKFFQSCSSSSLPLVIPVPNVWFLMFCNESMISRTFFFLFYVIFVTNSIPKDGILREFVFNYFALNFCIERPRIVTYPPLSGPIWSRFGAENVKLANRIHQRLYFDHSPEFSCNFFLPPHMLKLFEST